MSCLIAVFFVFCCLVNSQNLNKPIYIGGNSPYYEDTDSLYHSLENIQEDFRKDPQGTFAIRVCSNDPLPIAFADAAGVIYGINIVEKQLNFLRNTASLKIPESKIIFLRNTKGCKFYKNIPLTEYWFIPSYTDLPEFVETRKAEDIVIDDLIFQSPDNLLNIKTITDRLVYSFYIDEKINTSKKEIKLGFENIQAAKNGIAELLKKDKTAYLLINIPSSANKRNNIALKANEFKSYLVKLGIGSHRIFIKNCLSCFYPNNSEIQFPKVAIIYQK